MVGVVIVSYRNHRETIDFIKTQLGKVHSDWKAIVVENSGDAEIAKEIASECDGAFLEGSDSNLKEKEARVITVSPGENLGFARGNNLGARILCDNFDIDYLLFTNDDIIIEDRDVVARLKKDLDEKGDVAIVGPRVVGLDGGDQSPHYRVITPLRQLGWRFLPFLRGRKKGKEDAGANTTAPESGYCYWVSGCFFMMLADDFQAVGGFDEATFLYGEEVMLSERCKRIGKRAYFDSSVTVTHKGGNSTKNLRSEALRRYLRQSNAHYYREYLRSNPLIVWMYERFC